MKKELTDRQKEILEFINQFRGENGYPPTLREIGRNFGMASTFGVKRHLDALEKKGYLTVESNSSRAISVIEDNDPLTSNVFSIEDFYARIPIVGRVAAGTPISAIENIEGNLVVDSNLLKKGDDCFALRVKGESMINAGIFDGDLVIVSSQTEANNNDIIVAMIDNEATVKRFSNKRGKIQLLPENDSFSPIDVNYLENFTIIGKVVGIMRWYN
ncbi:MAG: transcriptional repressor LexA [Ignavibacteria bacterium]|jgi:repressor LexA|nr:transcriptional repressor LexA [Ignavibacteria bacterium]